MNHKCIIILFIFIFPFLVNANENDRYLEIKIKFSQSNLTVKQALDELSKLPEVSVVYNGNESFLDLQLTLPTQSISVQEALDIIWKQAPVDIVFNNNHIIVKGRKLKESYQFKGTIKDAETNTGLIAADIYLPGTTRGTVTDAHGNFTIALSPGTYRVAVNYVGYEEQELTVHLYEDLNIEVLMNTRQHPIDEVSISGTMGEMEVLERGRPIEKIDSKTVNQLNINNVNDALQGRINGVWATKVSGAPGDHYRIRIRGMNSIFGSTDPLYVVDGVMIPVVNFKTLGIADVNNHDVEEITILKDAASTALYGYMGGNGVVLIKTKRGGGKPHFNLSVKQGFQQQNKRYSLLQSEDFLGTLKKSDRLFGTQFYYTNPEMGQYPKYPEYLDSLGNELGTSDFQDELFRRGSISEVQFSGQGSHKSTDFYFSGNYYTHKGVVTNTRYDKYSFNGSLTHQFGDKLSLQLHYRGTVQENNNNLDNYLGNNTIYKGINYEPGYYFTPDSFLHKSDRLYFNDDYSGKYGKTVQELASHTYTPQMLLYEQRKNKHTVGHSLSLQAEYRISKNLSAQAFFALTTRNMQYESFIPSSGMYADDKFLGSIEEVGILNQQYDLKYQNVWQHHRLTGFIRYNNYRDNIYWKVDSAFNVELDGLTPEDNIYLRGSSSIFGETASIIRRMNAGIVNLNYNYRDKYNISVFANLDFLREGEYVQRSALFPSVAVDWDLSKESILLLPDWVSALHLRTSWGRSGNYPLNSLSNDIYITSPEFVVADTFTNATYISSLANHYLEHEVVTETNFGTRIALFDSRLILSADYFIKRNSDLLIQRTIPYYYGGGFFYQNIGEMQNKGIELSLEFTPVEQPNFLWTSRLNFSSNNQIITKLYDTVPINFNNTDLLYPDFYAKENEALGAITGFHFAGVWDDSIHSEAVTGTQKYFEVSGAAYYKYDTLNKYKLTENDKAVIGNSIPDFMCSWINLIRFRRFSCEMHWYAVVGVDKYNGTRATTYITGTSSNVRDMIADTLGFNRSSTFYKSSYFVEDASFLRLKTLTFRYEQPIKKPDGLGVEYAISFENLLTFTRYSGYDPEATIYTDNNFTDNAMDRGSYPNPMGVFLSVRLSF